MHMACNVADPGSRRLLQLDTRVSNSGTFETWKDAVLLRVVANLGETNSWPVNRRKRLLHGSIDMVNLTQFHQQEKAGKRRPCLDPGTTPILDILGVSFFASCRSGG